MSVKKMAMAGVAAVLVFAFGTAISGSGLGAAALGGTDASTFNLDAHVTASSLGGLAGPYDQRLKAVIGGKTYDLGGRSNSYALLKPGDYKAKQLKDASKNSYETAQWYEFLFPDGKTRQYMVVSISE